MADNTSHKAFFLEAMEEILGPVTAYHDYTAETMHRLEVDANASASQTKKGDDSDTNTGAFCGHMHKRIKLEQQHGDEENMFWKAYTYTLENAVPDRHINLEVDEDALSDMDVYTYGDSTDVYIKQESGGEEDVYTYDDNMDVYIKQESDEEEDVYTHHDSMDVYIKQESDDGEGVYTHDDSMDVYMGQQLGDDEGLDQQLGVHPDAYFLQAPLTLASLHEHDLAMDDEFDEGVAEDDIDEDDDDDEMSDVSSDTSVDKGSVYVDSDDDDSAYGDTPDSWVGEKRTGVIFTTR